MKRRLVALFTVIFLAMVSAARADNVALAEILRAKLLTMNGFTAVYEGKNNDTGQELRFEVRFLAPDRVRMDVVTQKFVTAYDGKVLVLQDQGGQSALSMTMDRADKVIRDATKSFADIADFVPGADTWSKSFAIHPFFLADLSEGNANLAVVFGARPEDAPWLNRLADNPDVPETTPEAIVIQHSDYRHTIDPKTGMLLAVEQVEKDKTRRYLKLVSFDPKPPAVSQFTLALPPGVKAEKMETDANAIDGVARSQFNVLLEQLLKTVTPKWSTLDDGKKARLSQAVTAYWRACFSADTQVRDRLVQMIGSAQSLELIKEQLADKEAKDEFIKAQKLEDPATIEQVWPRYVAATLTKEILSQTAEPYRQEIFESARKHVVELAKANKLSEEQADELLQKHTEGIVIALVESLQVPVRMAVDKAIEQVSAAKKPAGKE